MHSAISAVETCPRLWHVHCTRSMVEPAYTRNREIVVRSPSPTHLSFDGRFSHEIRLAAVPRRFLSSACSRRELALVARPVTHPTLPEHRETPSTGSSRCVLVSSFLFPSVCPSVRLSQSHAGIVSKRRHVARCSLHCQIAKCVQ